MKKTLFILIALLIVMTHHAQNKQTTNNPAYTQLWQQVEELEKKSLPKSASDVVDTILKQAVTDKNSPQVIKALIHQGKYNLASDTENDTLIFHNLNQMLKSTNDVVEKAVINSMLAELYLQYYNKDAWTINQRTQLADFVPEDMKEWTKNNFFNKVVEHTNTSLSAQAELEKTEVKTYQAVVNLGRESRTFYPTMFDFLALRALEILKGIKDNKDLSRSLIKADIDKKTLFASANEFVKLSIHPEATNYNLQVLVAYQKLLSSLQSRNLQESVVLIELDKLNFLKRLSTAYQLYAFDAIKTLHNEWKDKDFSVEIVNEMIGFYETPNVRGATKKDKQLKNNTETKDLYNLLQKTIATFPNYERIKLLKNKLSNITQPSFTVDGKKSFATSEGKRFGVNYRNIQQLNVKLYRMDGPLLLSNRFYNIERNENEKKTFVKEMVISLNANEAYLFDRDSFEISINEPGAYKLEFDIDKKLSEPYRSDYYFSVTNLAAFARSTSSKSHEVFVVNCTTGKPEVNAKVNVYQQSKQSRESTPTLLKTVPVNSLGLAVIEGDPKEYALYYHAVLGTDNGLPMTQLNYNRYERSHINNEKEIETISIFTDRRLYRPGQVVHFKAVAVSTLNNKHTAVPNKKIEFTLVAFVNQEVAKQTLTTNEFGSASGEFVLPQGMIPGGFSIKANNTFQHFVVEEYKRPTFEVAFDKIEKTYKFGEEVTLKGKAESFSGIHLQNAEVSYTITRQKAWWWRWGGARSEHFDEGIISTNDKGEFEIQFTPKLTDEDDGEHAIYSFTVEATVTDLNGETQVATYPITVGTVSMVLSIDMPEKMEKDSKEEIKIEAKNLDGNDIKATGTYQIFSLDKNDSIQQQVAEGAFEAGVQTELKSKLKDIPSGKYRIKLSAEDDRENTITAEKDVLVFSYTDKHPPIETNEWLVIKNSIFSKTKPAEIILGVTDKDVNVLYELWHGVNLLERKWITLSNENRMFTLPYKNEYAESATLILSYVKDDKFYTHNIGLMLEEEKLDLSIKLDVFRDKILPGGKEEWRISVTDSNQQPAIAEVLASMYDYSLNSIYATYPWRLRLIPDNRYIGAPRLSHDASFGKNSISGSASAPNLEFKDFQFDAFNWFDFSLQNNRQFFIRGVQSRAAGVAMDEVQVVAFGKQKKESIVGSTSTITSNELAVPSSNLTTAFAGRMAGVLEEQAPHIRKNFDETAFFYPQLRTNEKGETIIAFTVPESNTKWHFRLLAHDKNMNSATAEAFTVSQKKLMVIPNMPRFLREGDTTSISTKISNLSEEALNASVNIVFFNPMTDEEITTIDVKDKMQQVALAKDGSSSATWTFVVPDNSDVLGVRIVAESNLFSDGEQHALAILPNRMLVTESMRMDVNRNQTKQFTMDRLVNQTSNTLQNYRLTLEFASNPAWYAVQALPVLSNPENENAVSWFAAYYANTLGLHIANKYPKVKAMIDAWQKQGGDHETLLSNLEKNQELKNVLLEETPWVLAAKSETEQKQKLSLLFNLNRSTLLTNNAIKKLRELQSNSGGWTWFKGFSPSVSMTQYILYGFNQLNQMKATEFTDEVRAMQAKAISYIDTEALRWFKLWKKNNKDWKKAKSISTYQLEYLYVRSMYNQYPLNDELKEMNDFFSSVIEKNWTEFNLYQRSLISVLMQK
ncbi:MAG: alpha-2-macroglobulin family protein, partial [Dysgonamonadaceae bacterium]|nr:alpha-2-macroglobulin family protein [Dysgonamonadaceae bacterium]